MLLTSDGKLELEMDKLIGEAYARSPQKEKEMARQVCAATVT